MCDYLCVDVCIDVLMCVCLVCRRADVSVLYAFGSQKVSRRCLKGAVV